MSNEKQVSWCTCDEDCPIHGTEAQDSARTLLVERISFYGKERFTPLNDTARLFAEILDQVLLTPDDVRRIKALGYTVETKGTEGKVL